MLLRLLTIGLCTACVGLLAASPSVRIEVLQPAAPPAERVEPAGRLSVVDVASDVAPSSVAALVRLDAREWIAAIDDQPVNDDTELAREIRVRAEHGRFLDLTVVGGAAERRVLLLIH
ncbi:MAG: hypothetical protein H7138_24320 [Myxococcales bacterium]|nr:hypothetical protein [Myxococcales bacterium]